MNKRNSQSSNGASKLQFATREPKPLTSAPKPIPGQTSFDFGAIELQERLECQSDLQSFGSE